MSAKPGRTNGQLSESAGATRFGPFDESAGVRHFGRRVSSYARETPGGLFLNVRDGRVVGFGVEPIADVIVDRSGRVTSRFDRGPGRHVPRLVWAAPLAGAAGAVATGLVLRRHARAA